MENNVPSELNLHHAKASSFPLLDVPSPSSIATSPPTNESTNSSLMNRNINPPLSSTPSLSDGFIPPNINGLIASNSKAHRSIDSMPPARPQYDPSTWKFHCVRVWSKALKELPLAIDLPRLAANLSIINRRQLHKKQKQWQSLYQLGEVDFVEAIYSYKSRGLVMSTGDKDLSVARGTVMKVVPSLPSSWSLSGSYIDASKTITENGWTKVELNNGKVGVVPTSYIRKVLPPPISKERRTLDILAALTYALEGPERSQHIKDNFWRYIPRDTEKQRDVARELNKFLEEIVGEASPTI